MQGAGRRQLAAVVATAALGVAGCGDDETTEQPASINADLASVSFPQKQTLAKPATLSIAVRNPGARTIEQLSFNLATIDQNGREVSGFQADLGGSQASDPLRPVWIVDENPPDSTTADPGVFRTGPIPPGKTVKLKWRVQPVRVGDHTLRWTIGGPLRENARVVSSEGEQLKGELPVTIAP